MSTDYLTELFDEEVERQVLGLWLLAPHEGEPLGLEVEDFVINAHRTIFSEIVGIGTQEGEIDLIRLIAVLRQAGKLESLGGSAVICELYANVVIFNKAEFKRHIEILHEYKALRTLRNIGRKIEASVLQRATSTTILQDAVSQLAALSEHRAGTPWRSLGECSRVALEEIEAASKGEGTQRIKTGLKLLDARFHQIMEPQNLVIIAARPSMGKTSLALGLALEAAEQGKVVGIVSLEMSGSILAKRAMALKAEHLSISALDQGQLTKDGWRELTIACEGIDTIPIYLTDESTMSLPLLCWKARELQRKHGLDLLMVDYLQLMELSGKSRSKNEGIEELSRGLKVLARDLNIPVVVLSQLSRKCEDRGDRRPIPSDLRDSGAIEQDADVVWMVYRDEVYDRDSPDRGVAEMLIRKNRNGPIGDERVKFLAQRAKFEDL